MSKFKILSWTALVLWMAIIFILSHQPSSVSSELSGGITEFLIGLIEKAVPSGIFDVRDFHFIVRKNAHFIAYLVLGVLALNALKKKDSLDLRIAVSAFCLCVLYAASDEVHQLFIPGRSGEFRDVLIDSSGAAAGIALSILLSKILKRNSSSDKANRLSNNI